MAGYPGTVAEYLAGLPLERRCASRDNWRIRDFLVTTPPVWRGDQESR
jgi:hypothetical protein